MTKLTPIEIDPKTFFRKHFTLPSLPELTSKIQSMIQSDDADMKKVAELVNGDPALVAQVLKVVNSAYYGLPTEITEVRPAIAFLGLNEIYRMVLSLSVVNTLSIKQKDELATFWFHSFFATLCTKYLAKKYAPRLPREEFWSASILHDIGKLVYLKFFPEHYKELRRICKNDGCLFSEAERRLSLPSSASFGTLLCEHWRLPSHVRSACERHTLTDLQGIDLKTPSNRFTGIICLGNLLTVLSAEDLTDDTKHKISSATQETLDCTEPQFLTLMGDIYDLRNDVDKFMAQIR